MAWDSHLLILLNRGLAHPFLDVVMAGLTLVATPGPMLGFLLGLTWGRRREGITLLVAVSGATLLAVALQFALGRPRPAGVRLVLPMPTFPSFPSGHAAGAFALAVLAALFWPRLRLPAFLGAALVSLSRVYLGHHYPSDALGGAILGAATGAVVYGLCYRPAEAHRPRWTWLLWGQAAAVLLATLAASLGLLHFGFLALPGADRAFHFLLFGLLAFLAVGWWGRAPAWRVVLVLALLALAEEASQALVPGRSADPLDLAAAWLGLALGGWLAMRLRTRRRVRVA
jgi:undecaprenyl-diphosphatase